MSTSDNLKSIKNKLTRQRIFTQLKQQKSKQKHTKRHERSKEERADPSLKEKRLAENIPSTLENKRIYDETIGLTASTDEFSPFLSSGKDPKILLTTSKYSKKPAYIFADILLDFLPNTTFIKRKPEYSIKDIAKFATEKHFSCLVIINEDKKKVTGLTFIHLGVDGEAGETGETGETGEKAGEESSSGTDSSNDSSANLASTVSSSSPSGPTFYFSITNVTDTKEIENHGRATTHIPELILNNFSSRLGNTVGRLFQSIFPPRPELQGRQTITLHNQRDFIFFRRHRYVFRNEERVGLQELGPQFTLKLRRIQKGVRGEVVWEHRPDMEKDKKKFYL